MSDVPPRAADSAVRARTVGWLRDLRYVVEIVVLTIALWLPLCSISMIAVVWLLAHSSYSRGGPTASSSELPGVGCFLALIAANYLARPGVRRLERFWERRGW